MLRRHRTRRRRGLRRRRRHRLRLWRCRHRWRGWLRRLGWRRILLAWQGLLRRRRWGGRRDGWLRGRRDFSRRRFRRWRRCGPGLLRRLRRLGLRLGYRLHPRRRGCRRHRRRCWRRTRLWLGGCELVRRNRRRVGNRGRHLTATLEDHGHRCRRHRFRWRRLMPGRQDKQRQQPQMQQDREQDRPLEPLWRRGRWQAQGRRRGQGRHGDSGKLAATAHAPHTRRNARGAKGWKDCGALTRRPHGRTTRTVNC